MAVRVIDSIEEYQQIIKSDKLVVIDFSASWCGPCKVIEPKVDALASIYGQVNFYKADVDDAEDVAALAKVSAMPTFQFYQNGQLLATVVGANIAGLKSNLQRYA